MNEKSINCVESPEENVRKVRCPVTKSHKQGGWGGLVHKKSKPNNVIERFPDGRDKG